MIATGRTLCTFTIWTKKKRRARRLWPMADRPAQQKTDIRSSAFIALVAVAAIGIGFGIIGARVRFGQELRQWQRRYSSQKSHSSVELPARPRLEPLEPHSAKSSAAFFSWQREQEATLREYGRT